LIFIYVIRFVKETCLFKKKSDYLAIKQEQNFAVCRKNVERVQKTKLPEMSISPAWHQVLSILQFDEDDGTALCLCQNHQPRCQISPYGRVGFDRGDKWNDISRPVFRRHWR